MFAVLRSCVCLLACVAMQTVVGRTPGRGSTWHIAFTFCLRFLFYFLQTFAFCVAREQRVLRWNVRTLWRRSTALVDSQPEERSGRTITRTPSPQTHKLRINNSLENSCFIRGQLNIFCESEIMLHSSRGQLATRL